MEAIDRGILMFQIVICATALFAEIWDYAMAGGFEFRELSFSLFSAWVCSLSGVFCRM